MQYVMVKSLSGTFVVPRCLTDKPRSTQFTIYSSSGSFLCGS